MPTTPLVWLDVWVLHWLEADAQRHQGLLAAPYQQLLASFTRHERWQIQVSLARLEAKGLIVVGRAPGGRPAYLALTAAGSEWVHHVPRPFDLS